MNARDFRGPDAARGSTGEYAGVALHAGLICLHGATRGLSKQQQLEVFAVALDLVERHGGEATNLLIEITWRSDGITREAIDFPPAG
jgi:hypothetical protein